MPKFCLNQNKNVSGKHELHAIDGECEAVPHEYEQVPIGLFKDGATAMKKARLLYPNVEMESCFHCCADIKIDS